MELEENAKENVWMQAIQEMTEKDIRYKESINKKIAGIKIRQIISITISCLILITLVGILNVALNNMHDITELIKVLIDGFTKISK